ncbi:oxidoreductase [Hypoxylon sp. FL0543]|nr:oxidoreductase [Hypoxylon sp. FL0543]
MASERLFRQIPPFPDNVPTASMDTISLADLRSGNAATAKQIMVACQELGFFILDLHGDGLGEAVIEEIDQLFDLAKDLMSLPDEEKERYLSNPPESFLGFKRRGQAKTETNAPDRFEWFNLSQDGLIGTTPLQPVPPLVDSQLPLFTSFLKHGQNIVTVISSTLASQLGLPPDAFTTLQQPFKPSGTVVRIIKAFASPEQDDLRTSMIHHTDFGTITLLANVLGGLQILAPGKPPEDENAWLWVRPRPGCLIVNLGDAMVQWTGGLLRSNTHRIYHAPGEQRFVDRYSLALLVRPESEASMKRLVGEGEDGEDGNLTAWEWEVKKAMALVRGDAAVQSKGGKPLAAV